MKKVEFSTGDKVVTIKDGELRKGVIKNFYPITPPVFVIEFEDGSVEKVLYSNVAPEPKTETPEENAPVEKPEITITPSEFREITCRVIAEETKKHKIVGLAFASLMGKIHRALFIESWENEKNLN